MLTVKIQCWDGAEEVVECERVVALRGELLRGPEETLWYDARTVICYFNGDTSSTFSTCDGRIDPDGKEKRNAIYVMNDKGRTIANY